MGDSGIGGVTSLAQGATSPGPRAPRPVRGATSLGHATTKPLRRLAGLIAALPLLLGGCASVGSVLGGAPSGPPAGTPGFVRGFLGGVAAEDPAAALAARNVLSAGGTAADAAVAAGFTMAVTLPSRVGLGGGGACLIHDPAKRAVEAVLFPPGPRGAGVPSGADRPAAVPLLARGLFALHTRMPGRPFEELLAGPEQLARFGTEIGRALAADLAAVSGPLFADPVARAVFAGAAGGPKQAGELLVQPALAATFRQFALAGVGDLHQGVLARRLAEGSAAAGGGLTIEALRAGLPSIAAPIVVAGGRRGDQVAFLPPPADGGLAAAAGFEALRAGAGIDAALARGLAVAVAARAQGGAPAQLLAATLPAATPPPLPASAGLVVFDRFGGAVACAFTLNNLFGTGRMVPELGFLLAAAPDSGQVAAPLLAAGIAYNPNVRAFRMAAAGAGQAGAAIAVGGPMGLHLLRNATPAEALAAGAPAPGRTQLAACPGGLPGAPETCVALSDPRGAGVAVGTIQP